MRRGFTLVEVVVAVVILEVGVLGAVGVLHLALQTFAAAEAKQRVANVLEALADSLAEVEVVSPGTRVVGPGTAEWSVAGEGWVSLRVEDPVLGTAVEILAPATGASGGW
jgi:prepilin-type N-terminal cleavage/methylation domain-containing protein